MAPRSSLCLCGHERASHAHVPAAPLGRGACLQSVPTQRRGALPSYEECGCQAFEPQADAGAQPARVGGAEA